MFTRLLSSAVCPSRWAAIGALLAALPFAALGQSAPPPAPVPGATVEELLTIARRLNPTVAAAALETEAALARASIAGELADPNFRVEFNDNERMGNSLFPDRLGTRTFSIQQAFPLGGKRELKREIAQADVRQADGKRRSAEAELMARVKIVFAQLYRASQTRLVLDELRQTTGTLLGIAEARYAQGLGSIQDTLRARIEASMLEGELARADAERAGQKSRLNALLNRPAEAPLGDPRLLRPLPDPGLLILPRLIDQARRSNPEIASETAAIEAADGTTRLAERAWYPDIAVGVGVVERSARITAYEATLEFNIPLRWGLRDGQRRESVAMAAAARSRREAATAQTEAELGESVAMLDSLRRIAKLLEDTTVPQSRAALRAGMQAYELSRLDATAVVDAAIRLRQAQLELLKTRAEQQIQLANIERLIGDDL